MLVVEVSVRKIVRRVAKIIVLTTVQAHCGAGRKLEK
jgi:hypothetical protein